MIPGEGIATSCLFPAAQVHQHQMSGLIFDTFPGEQQLRLPQGCYNNRREDTQDKILLWNA